MKNSLFFILSLLMLTSCQTSSTTDTIVSEEQNATKPEVTITTKTIRERLNQYTPITLNVDLSTLSNAQKQVVANLIKAAKFVNIIFCKQSFDKGPAFLSTLNDSDSIAYFHINYGPWDRLENNAPFVTNVKKRPLGANFYPHDIKYLPFLQFKDDKKTDAYTIIRRHDDGSLFSVPYHEFFKPEIDSIVHYMRLAAEICPNKDFKNYLNQRIQAIETDQYIESDKTWMALKNNTIDFVIGAFETEEDQFLNLKTAYEAMVLLKDNAWTEKVKSIKTLLPDLKSKLPVEQKYKDALASINKTDIIAYNVLYFSGFDNAGPKHITLTRPMNPRTVIETGSRKLEFENIIEAKFNSILKPIANIMIDKTQVNNLKANAFFENSLFYEIGDGFFFKQLINGDKDVKNALKEHYNTIKKINNDILRLFILQTLKKDHKLEGNINDNYLAFFADFFRILRLSDNIPQVKGNIITFNYFSAKGVISKTKGGLYHIDLSKMEKTVNDFTKLILKIEGNGDYKSACELIEDYGSLSPQLKADLSKTKNGSIPIDIRLNQGIEILGIQ